MAVFSFYRESQSNLSFLFKGRRTAVKQRKEADMAITVIPDYTDTTGGATHEISIPSVNFGADFRVASNEPDEIIITNLTSPLGYAEVVRFQTKQLADIYANTSVDKALYAASRKGRQIYIALNDIFRVVDSNDASFEMALPLSASLTVKFPQNAMITQSVIVALIERLVGLLFETDDEAMSPRIKALIRGSLKPKDL
jgi:hypothetical protein